MRPPPAAGSLGSGYRLAVERSIAFSGLGHDFFVEAKAERLAMLARRRIGDPRDLSVLDVGCGPGILTRRMARSFARAHGIDVAREALAEAGLAGGGASYSLYDGARLPFPDAAFDLLVAACVLHHVPRAGRAPLAREMLRVTRATGGIVVFEHNPFHPLTRLAVSRCELDREAELLALREVASLLEEAGGRIVERRHILFLPFRGKAAAAVEELLRWTPLGAQHMVFAASRPSPG